MVWRRHNKRVSSQVCPQRFFNLSPLLQITLLQFWEKTARSMSEIHKAFQGHVQYQFTTLKVREWTFTAVQLVCLQRKAEKDSIKSSL